MIRGLSLDPNRKLLRGTSAGTVTCHVSMQRPGALPLGALAMYRYDGDSASGGQAGLSGTCAFLTYTAAELRGAAWRGCTLSGQDNALQTKHVSCEPANCVAPESLSSIRAHLPRSHQCPVSLMQDTMGSVWQQRR